MDRELRHYVIDENTSSQVPPHQHDYQYVAGGEHAVRYCPECGKSWALVQMRNLINNQTFFQWESIREEEESLI